MRRRDVIAGAVLALAAAAVAWRSLTLGVGTLTHPGAGFMPFVLALVLAGAGGAIAVAAARRRGETDAAATPVVGARVAAAVAAMVGYAAVLPWLGFLAATAALMAFLFVLAYGRGAIVPAAAGGVAMAAASYVLFEWMLEAGLPAGRLWS